MFPVCSVSHLIQKNPLKKLQRYERIRQRGAVVRRALAPVLTDNIDVDDFTLEDPRDTPDTVLNDESQTHTCNEHLIFDIPNVVCEETVSTHCDDSNSVSQQELNESLHDHNYSLVLTVDYDDILETSDTNIDIELSGYPGSPEYVAEPYYDSLPDDPVPEQEPVPEGEVGEFLSSYSLSYL